MNRGTPDLEPMRVDPVTLEGTFVRLVPMEAAHVEDFVAIGLGHGIFRWYPFSVETPEEMRDYVRAVLGYREQGSWLPFTTIERATGRIAGSTSYLAIDRDHRRLEVGATWLGVPWQRTALNTEAKYLQLRHCFEVLGCRRVEFKTDSLNEKSRAALTRIGAVEEGTFRNHMICPGGRQRDSVYYSVIDSDWPAVKERLEKRLAGQDRS